MARRRRALAILAAGIAVAVPSASAAVRPGALDTSFGTGGSVYGVMGARTLKSADVNGAVVEPDGSYVLAGTSGVASVNASALLLARYRADGTPDPSFGHGGFVTTPVGDEATADGVALQPDGGIVAVGSVRTGSSVRVLLARYDADGSLDDSFGAGGTVTSVPGAATAVAVQPNGRIAVAAHDAGSCSTRLAVIRYEADGSPDTSFGSGGVAIANLGAGACASEDALLVTGDGRIVVAGAMGGELVLARFTSDGAPDGSFGDGGVDTVSLGASYAAAPSPARVLLQSDGGIVLATSGTAGFAVVRLLSDGSLDTSFGSGGIATVPQPGVAGALALQSDGGVLFAGGGLTGTPMLATPGVLAGLDANGGLNPGFGTGGTAPFGLHTGGNDPDPVPLAPDPVAVAPDAGGGFTVIGGATQCVAAAESCTISFSSLALARFDSSGLPDPEFGDGGQVLGSPPGSVLLAARNSHPKALVAEPDGSVIVAGDAYAYDVHPYPGGSGFTLLKYLSDGRPDPEFGSDGSVATSLARDPSALPATATTALRQSDGKIVVAGVGHVIATGQVFFAVARYGADGSLDPSFGNGGIVRTTFSALKGNVADVALTPRGKIVVGGNVGPHAKVVRYRRDGSLDRSFGGDGIVTFKGLRSVGTLRAVGLLPSGRVLVAGTRGLPGPYSGAMVELEADGSRVLSFGGERGVASVPVGSQGSIGGLLAGIDGQPLVFGRNGGHHVVVFRYQDDGGPDHAFNRRARRVRRVSGIGGSAVAGALDTDGNLVLGGSDHQRLALVRVQPSGALDRSFGTGGAVVSTVYGRLKAIAAAGDRIIVTGDAGFSDPDGSNRATAAVIAAFRG